MIPALVNGISLLALALLAFELWLGPKKTVRLYDPESDRYSTVTGTRLAVWGFVRFVQTRGWQVTDGQGSQP